MCSNDSLRRRFHGLRRSARNNGAAFSQAEAKTKYESSGKAFELEETHSQCTLALRVVGVAFYPALFMR